MRLGDHFSVRAPLCDYFSAGAPLLGASRRCRSFQFYIRSALCILIESAPLHGIRCVRTDLIIFRQFLCLPYLPCLLQANTVLTPLRVWVGLSVSLPALIVFSVITLQHYTRMECCFRLICQLNDNEVIVSLLSGTCHRGRQKLVGSVAFIPNVVGPCSWLVTLYVEWL